MKRKRMSKQYKYFHTDELWCVIDINHNVAMLVSYAFITRKKCLALFMLKYGERGLKPWKYWYRRGYRLAKIRIYGEY